jgi:hypothetical protein
MAFDLTVPYHNESSFKECNWKDFYGNVEEAILSNAPKPRGESVHI